MQKIINKLIIYIFLIFPIGAIYSQQVGQDIFNKACTACHTIGDGKLVGPDLSNIQKKQTKEWIIKFVQSSQAVVKTGDSAAVALFNEYNKIIMPDQPYTASEITSIIDYIAANSPDSDNPNKKTPNQIFNSSLVTDLDIERGKNIFEGNIKLTNNGPPCISCHNVDYPGLMSGGLLALDLTQSFTRLSAAGVNGIIRNPPFPAMINSFGKAQLTDEEVKNLLAFLYDSDRIVLQQPTALQANFVLLIGVIVGINIAFVLLLFMWQRVKKYSVNNR